MYKKFLFLVFLLPISYAAWAQYDLNAGYHVVYNILNTKCSNTTCHSAASLQSLKFDGSDSVVYAQLYGNAPSNIAAHSRGEKLVWGNQPYQSYLLKKAGSWFDTDLSLPAGEADSAAHAGAGLSNNEVEYIRQWIMNGATKSDQTIDTGMINAYYGDTARGPFFPKPAKPAAGTGVQVRVGPIFLSNSPGRNEVEQLLMNQIVFPTDMEVTGMDLKMNSFSHHFILFRFDDSVSAMEKKDGFRTVVLSTGSTVSPFDGNKSVSSVWVYGQDIKLPAGTAFFWPKTAYVDLDFHVKNYSTYSVLPFDVYINLAATPRNPGNGVIEMKSRLQNNTTLGLVDLQAPYHLNTIAPHRTSMCIDADQDNGSNGIRYLWMLNSHTHKMGVGFNIYTYDKNKSNSLGDTVYVGNYDYNSSFDRGYYDWEHPSAEIFPTLKPIDFHTSGLIAQTYFKNDSSFYQRFGFTTADEMQLFYYLYTTQLPGTLGVKDADKSAFDFKIYPNPMPGKGVITYTLDAAAVVQASILDITGKEVAALKNDNEQAGTYDITLGDKQLLSTGMYFAKISVNGTNYTRKFIIE